MRTEATRLTVPPDDRRKESRVPLAVSVQYRLEGWDGFVEEYAPNLSYNGLFLVTRELHPVGTELTFELRLADDQVALSGHGIIRWVRAERPGVPPGIGIQFTQLDAENERRVREAVDRYLAAKVAGLATPPLRLDVLGVRPSQPPAPVPWVEPPTPVDAPSVAARTVPERSDRVITVLVGVIALLAAVAAVLAALGD